MRTLTEFYRDFPDLTLNNDGYEYLSNEIQNRYKDIIFDIETILKRCIKGFMKFNNFKQRANGTVDVRCQYKWDESFTGVGYFNIDCIELVEKNFNK